MKKKIILLVVIIACLIPSLIAYLSHQNTQDAPIDIRTAVMVSIVDIDGKNYTYTKDKNNEEAASGAAMYSALSAGASLSDVKKLIRYHE